MEINDLLLLVAGGIIGILGGYFVTYTSNPLAERIREWRSKREQDKAKKSVISATKRRDKLEQQLQIATQYHQDTSSLVAYGLYFLMTFAFATMFLIALAYAGLAGMLIGAVNEQIIGLLGLFTIGILLLTMMFLAIPFQQRLWIILHLDAHRTFVETQIAELQEVIDRSNQPTERT